MSKNPQKAKQFTLDNLPDTRQKDAVEIIRLPQEEQIIITQIESKTGEDELALKVAFKLPIRIRFSMVKADLLFDNQPVNSIVIRLLQGPLATEEAEFSAVYDMKGIGAGAHTLGVEMYGLWDSGEKLCRAFREVTINYVPLSRQSRLVRVPSVRSVGGADLSVVSEAEKDIYKDIEKTMKREYSSKRDNW